MALRNLIFAPAERIIIERGANVVSLISVLEELSLEIRPEKMPGADDVSPQVWYVLTVWRGDQEDIGSRFQPRVELVNPAGKSIFELRSEVLEFTKLQHRHVFTVRGFPIGMEGTYWLKLSSGPGDGTFREISQYPIIVKHEQTKLAHASQG